MNHSSSFVAFFILLFFSSCSTQPQKSTPVSHEEKTLKVLKPSSSELKLVELDHVYFKVGYDPELRLAHYVVYELTAEKLRLRKASRRNKFRPDPLLISLKHPYVKPAEYRKSGYDQGHLAPSADFAWSQEAQDLTFVMSNMAPQKPKLNRDAWKRLEAKVRRWACGEEKVTVITGPILKKSVSRLKSGLRVPESFYKIIIDETPPRKAIAFIYHQNDKGDVLEKRVAPLGEVNRLAAIRFNSLIDGYSTFSRAPASVSAWKEADCSN